MSETIQPAAGTGTSNGKARGRPPGKLAGGRKRAARKAPIANQAAGQASLDPLPIVRATKDPELALMATISFGLDALAIPARKRVCSWIEARYAEFRKAA